MRQKSIAFYGGSFNPPTIAHRHIISHLCNSSRFDTVIVKPCGMRGDKPELQKSLSQRKSRIQHELISCDCPKLRLDLDDMGHPMKPTFTEWEDLSQLYPDSKIWIVGGSDLFEKDRSDGLCQVQRWYRGGELFQKAHFWIYPRPIDGSVAWPRSYHYVEDFPLIDISSSALRALERS